MLEITLKLSVRSYIVWTINWIFSISRSDQPNSSSHKYWMRERKENIQFAQVFLVPGTLRLPKTRSVFLYSSPSVYDIEDENNEKKDNGFSKMNILLYCLNYILQIQMFLYISYICNRLVLSDNGFYMTFTFCRVTQLYFADFHEQNFSLLTKELFSHQQKD